MESTDLVWFSFWQVQKPGTEMEMLLFKVMKQITIQVGTEPRLPQLSPGPLPCCWLQRPAKITVLSASLPRGAQLPLGCLFRCQAFGVRPGMDIINIFLRQHFLIDSCHFCVYMYVFWPFYDLFKKRNFFPLFPTQTPLLQHLKLSDPSYLSHMCII